jgi:uroporphyrinogen-III synthase
MKFQSTAQQQALIRDLDLAGGSLNQNLSLISQPPKSWDALVESGAQVLIAPNAGTLNEIARQLWQASYTGPCHLILRPASNLRSAVEVELKEFQQVQEPNHSDWRVFLGEFSSPNWFLSRPLHGVTVVNTRAVEQASSLTERLEAQGAEVIHFPCLQFQSIREAELERAMCQLDSYQWIVFTSSNGVDQTLRALLDSGRDLRSLSKCKLATIGTGTAARLREWNLISDLTPPEFVAESLLESLLSLTQPGDQILLARAEEARDVVPIGLRQAGRQVHVVAVYRTVEVQHEPAALQLARESDWVVLASSSAAKHYTCALGGVVESQKVLAIGPITEQTARELGWSKIATATIHNLDGVLQCLIENRPSSSD